MARKRLHAIFSASDLGAGYQIALSDLEIRGAGNILGAEQHGFMAAVGFELYTRMLAEAVDVRRGRVVGVEPAPVRMDLPGSAYLPDAYVGDSGAKLEMYRRFAVIRSDSDAEQLRADLRDRFGPIPPAVEGLFRAVAVRMAAEAAGVPEVRADQRLVTLKWPRFDRQAVSLALARRRLPAGAGLEPGAAAGGRRPRPGGRRAPGARSPWRGLADGQRESAAAGAGDGAVREDGLEPDLQPPGPRFGSIQLGVVLEQVAVPPASCS